MTNTSDASVQLRHDVRTRFLARRPFTLDTFQRDAMDALDENASVVVAAPTGSGKTLVAEYAIAIAYESGSRAFYTTPLKALSNQKFHDLQRAYGNDQIGLLTGDNVINPQARIVVMTTEVLRNMIYVNAPALMDLQYVILDEVHYLQNAYRGPVWEEVIIHLPPEVDLVCLSATVSNAEQLAEWIGTVRGATAAIIEETRPVTLEQHYLVATRHQDALTMIPTFGANGKPNPRGAHFDANVGGQPWRRHARKPRFATPSRSDVILHLERNDMLPAIYFIFSRNGCDDAVRQCVNAGVRLTSADERVEIRAIAERHVEALSDDDLDALNYTEWLHALECGVGAHHAGLVPPLKEAVEECFTKAFVKAVFATETLSLGLNMPARTVVIEKLTKFTGERHESLTPGEFTQLTGRAGRRGIDEIGHAVTLWSPFVDFAAVAALASTRTYKLTSSFRPTYNMAANLVRRYRPDVAHHLLNLSFAQFSADTDIVRMEAELDRMMKRIEVAQNNVLCEHGDVAAWAAKNTGTSRSVTARDAHAFIERSLAQLRIGDVIRDPAGDGTHPLVVLTTAQRRGRDTRLGMLTRSGRRFSLSARDFFVAPHRLTHLELPRPYAPGDKEYVRRCADALNAFAPPETTQKQGVGACNELGVHLQALDEVARLELARDGLKREIKSRSESLARQFDRVIALLRRLGYVEEWSLTPAGTMLSGLYHEADLLVVEAICEGVFDDLSAPELAAVVSYLTYESRGPLGTDRNAPQQLPTKTLRKRWHHLRSVWEQLVAVEEDVGVMSTRLPDVGFANAAYAWASGSELPEILEDDEDLSGGDFVRNVKQLIDLLRQLADVAHDSALTERASDATKLLFRGIVAASTVTGALADD